MKKTNQGVEIRIENKITCEYKDFCPTIETISNYANSDKYFTDGVSEIFEKDVRNSGRESKKCPTHTYLQSLGKELDEIGKKLRKK